MGQRSLRVNVLVKQALSSIMHTRFRGETVNITITEVDVSPDLRNAIVYYSVFGGEEKEKQAAKFIRQRAHELRRLMSKEIVLKYLPYLRFELDHSIERGVDMVQLMDEVAETDEEKHSKDDS